MLDVGFSRLLVGQKSWDGFAVTLHAFGSAVIVGFANMCCACLECPTIPTSSLLAFPYIWVSCLRRPAASCCGDQTGPVSCGGSVRRSDGADSHRLGHAMYFQRTLREKPPLGLVRTISRAESNSRCDA